MHENDISGIILDAAIEAHRTLGGPGLLESAYLGIVINFGARRVIDAYDRVVNRLEPQPEGP